MRLDSSTRHSDMHQTAQYGPVLVLSMDEREKPDLHCGPGGLQAEAGHGTALPLPGWAAARHGDSKAGALLYLGSVQE
jgi:hypothetical protein